MFLSVSLFRGFHHDLLRKEKCLSVDNCGMRMFDVIAVYIAVVDAVMLPHKNAVGLLPADVSDVFFLL